MFICIAKISYYELQLESNLKDRRGGVSKIMHIYMPKGDKGVGITFFR